jgi:hypothetical protein
VRPGFIITVTSPKIKCWLFLCFSDRAS